jgi:hypothetical protein
MIELDFSNFEPEAIEYLKQFTGEQYNKAASRALNHTAAKLQSASSAEIRKVYKIKHKDLGAFHKLSRATPKNLAAKVLVDYHTLGMGNFSPKEVTYAKSKAIDYRVFKNKKIKIKKGPTRYAKAAQVEILKGKKVTIIGTWTRTFDKSGKTGVFARGRYLKNGGGFEWGKDPKVWRSLKTKSPFFAILNSQVRKNLIDIAYTAYTKRIWHELNKGLKHGK